MNKKPTTKEVVGFLMQKKEEHLSALLLESADGGMLRANLNGSTPAMSSSFHTNI